MSAAAGAQYPAAAWGCFMRKDSALAYLAIAELDRETDDEIDLLAESEDEICPTCGGLLIEYEDDVLLLECPVCDRRFR
jgi:hypothetical protein